MNFNFKKVLSGVLSNFEDVKFGDYFWCGHLLVVPFSSQIFAFFNDFRYYSAIVIDMSWYPLCYHCSPDLTEPITSPAAVLATKWYLSANDGDHVISKEYIEECVADYIFENK